MEHLILADTKFFRLISSPDGHAGLSAAYEEFIAKTISLCTHAGGIHCLLHALSYAETELQYHKALQGRCHENELNLHVHKALAFVRKMLRCLVMEYRHVPPPASRLPDTGPTGTAFPEVPGAEAPPMRWTGTISDLVELLYGLDTLKCVNGGETGIHELWRHFTRFFGMELKDNQCYNAYVDIRRRKNESRTYFFDRAAEKLNRRIADDDERERKRKK